MDTELKEYLELQFKSLRSEMANKNDLKGMATKDDIRNMATKDDIRNMATKDDIRNMATKDDIKNMATKDDIRNMATKDDIKNMTTKDDIRNMATKDDIKNMATKDDIKAVKAEMTETKEELKRHMGVLYENMQHKLDIAIEGFQSLTERDERLKKEIDETDKKIGQVSLNLSAHK